MNAKEQFIVCTITLLKRTFAVIGLLTSQALQAQISLPSGGTCGSQGGCTSALTGNPIDIVTGNKFREEVDLAVPGLPIVRYYNSKSDLDNPLGVNWRLSYHISLTSVKPNEWTLIQGDGRRIQFGNGPGAVLPTVAQMRGQTKESREQLANIAFRYVARDPQDGTLQVATSGYTWFHTNGTQFHFNIRRQLVRIQSAPQQPGPMEALVQGQAQPAVIYLNYDNDARLIQVSDSLGRKLLVSYYDAVKRKTTLSAFSAQADQPKDKDERAQSVPTVEAAGRIKSIEFVGRDIASKTKPDTLRIRVDYAYNHDTTLTKVSYPDGTNQQYRYEQLEHPYHLTKIVGRGGEDQFHFAYDSQGRAIRSERAGGVERVTLRAQLPATSNGEGQTWLTNALGHTTLYTWRYDRATNLPLITGAIGPGCSSCPPSNVRMLYNRRNQLIKLEQLEIPAAAADKTEPTLAQLRSAKAISAEITDYDTHGRTVAQYRKHGTQKSLLARYSYGADVAKLNFATFFKPMSVERPSVVTGKFHAIRFTYNDLGQTTKLDETGFSPIDKSDHPTNDPREATTISRTTSYGYTILNSVSVLTQIDGPLPNGPKGTSEDSDITQLQYANQSDKTLQPLLQSKTTPGGFTTAFTFDAAGRLGRLINGDKQFVAFRYNDASAYVDAVTHRIIGGEGWSKQSIDMTRYDAVGSVVEQGQSRVASSDNDNSSVFELRAMSDEIAKHYRARYAQGYDDAGRSIWRASSLGMLAFRRYDAASRVIEDGTTTNRIRKSQRYGYDSFGRMFATPAEKKTASGRESTNGDVAITTVRWQAPATIARSVRPVHLQDDFGRRVATLSPNTGLTRRQFNELDLLVAMQDANGSHASYQYDSALRIQEQRMQTKGKGTIPQASAVPSITLTRWGYEGSRLVRVEHPTQTELYGYDLRGLRTSRTVVIPVGNEQSIVSTVRYEHDHDGTLIAQTLPDGSRLVYERNGQGQIVAVKRNRIHSIWMRRFARDEVIASDFQRDLVGLKQYTAGNGIVSQWQRARDGSLARVVHGKSTSRARPQLLEVDGQLGASDLPRDASTLLDHRYLWDHRGNLLLTQSHQLNSGGSRQAAYAYDETGQVLSVVSGVVQGTAEGAVNGEVLAANDVAGLAATNSQLKFLPERSWRYAHDNQQRRVLTQETIDQGDVQSGTSTVRYQLGTHQLDGVEYDLTGMPLRQGQRDYEWDAAGRLIEVRDNSKLVARYSYDHRGLRNGKTLYQSAVVKSTYSVYSEDRQLLAEIDANGKLARQYLTIADLPIAVIDLEAGTDLKRPLKGGPRQAADDVGTRAFWSDVKALLASWINAKSERIAYLHINHLGAPEAATDRHGQVMWQAAYTPFGAVTEGSLQSKDRFVLNLRLPGQYEDRETGLHYNRARYYDPKYGRYLSPDPTGTPDGPNPYAYVANNPLKYVDPDGLVLFAFDGTGNSDDSADPAMGSNGMSNVWRFYENYRGEKYYVAGVGTVDRDRYHMFNEQAIRPDQIVNASDIIWWVTSADTPKFYNDMGGNYSATQRMQRMENYFNFAAEIVKDSEVMQIDIVGFSRGAAQARHFASMVAGATSNGVYNYYLLRDGKLIERKQCVNYRFMGLWETVLSTNYGSTDPYRMAIPSVFKHVAHAVALNEYRSDVPIKDLAIKNTWDYRNPKDYKQHYGGFPLESIGASSNQPGKVRVELGFIGAHADVGGGYPDDEAQLSQISLNWMERQALDAGVTLRKTTALDNSDAAIHDQSMAIRVGNPLAARVVSSTRGSGVLEETVLIQDGKTGSVVKVEDREVRGAYRGNSARTMGFNNSSMRNVDTHQFINYTPRTAQGQHFDSAEVRALKNRTGTVRVGEYVTWLRNNGYCFVGDTQAGCDKRP